VPPSLDDGDDEQPDERNVQECPGRDSNPHAVLDGQRV
jgi:hypothetical protein